jgi:hypothetical protein
MRERVTSADDPYVVLGVERGVTEDELRAARRRAARRSHPDKAGGSADVMRRINVAFDAVMADLARVSPGVAEDDVPASPEPPAPAPAPRTGSRLSHDVASFTIEALPAVAFEALLIVATWLGEVVDDDPPYRLDVVLADPLTSWCRLELLPDAGASTVAITLGAIDAAGVPDIDAVRDAWVAALNSLGPDEDP